MVPAIQDRSTAKGNVLIREVAIEGHVAVNRSRRAVTLHTRVGSFIIPLVSFQRVARGDAISAPLFSPSMLSTSLSTSSLRNLGNLCLRYLGWYRRSWNSS